VTQPALFALTDGEHSEVTEGGINAPLNAAQRGASELPEKRNDGVKGAIVERLFEIAALERGYEISVNIGGGKDFDYIVRLPGGRPVVVQIKTGCWADKNCSYEIKNYSKAGIYAFGAYDVLAVYLPDRRQWLFYLRTELGNRSRTSYTPPEIRRRLRKSFTRAYGESVTDRDPDNWELLDQVAAMYSQESLGVAQPMSDPQLYI
jgi:hypothetical protein